MNIRRSTLIGTAVAFALYHQSATAQTAMAASSTSVADVEQVDEIIVTGVRASLEKSLEVKRNADSRLEVVTAEDVGRRVRQSKTGGRRRGTRGHGRCGCTVATRRRRRARAAPP